MQKNENFIICSASLTDVIALIFINNNLLIMLTGIHASVAHSASRIWNLSVTVTSSIIQPSRTATTSPSTKRKNPKRSPRIECPWRIHQSPAGMCPLWISTLHIHLEYILCILTLNFYFAYSLWISTLHNHFEYLLCIIHFEYQLCNGNWKV